jgi:hypothetical protein
MPDNESLQRESPQGVPLDDNGIGVLTDSTPHHVPIVGDDTRRYSRVRHRACSLWPANRQRISPVLVKKLGFTQGSLAAGHSTASRTTGS